MTDGIKNNGSLRAKKVEFSLTQIAFTDLMANRMARLSNKVSNLEDKVLGMANLGGLTNTEKIILHRILSKVLGNNSDYVQKVLATIDWVDLESQLILMTEDKGEKVDLDVTRGAECLLKRLHELKMNDPQKIKSPEDFVGEALKLSSSEDGIDPTI